MSNEEILKRLLELSISHADNALQDEQKELVQKLASNVGIALDAESREVSEDKQDHEHTPVVAENPSPRKDTSDAAQPAENKSAPQQSVSSARDKFEQDSKKNESPVPARPRKGSLNNSNEPLPQRKGSVPTPRAPQAVGSPGANECDISDSNILEAYEKVRDDSNEQDWMLMGYGTSKKALQLYNSGNGGLKDFVAHLPENEVLYGYVRMLYGDSGRAKFVFITYVPETLSGLAKAKANMHKPSVDQFLKYHHIQVYASSPADLQETTIQTKLQAAAGANYGTGGVAPAGSENFGSIKNNARSFFSETEKKGTVKIVYNKDALSTTTPVSLTGRAGITEKYITK